MDSKEVKQEEEAQKQDAKNEKGRQNLLLIALLVLVGGFSYIYFFTDIIRTQGENKTVESPAASAIKKTLPPRDGAAVKTDAATASAVKNEQVAPTAAESVKAVPVAPVKVEPAKVAPAVAVTQPVKSKEEPKKVEPANAVEKKVVAVAPIAKEKKTPVAKKTETKSTPVEAAVKTGSWTVLAGNYVLEGNLASDQAKIKKAGLDPVIKSAGRKKTMMNRLLLVELVDRSAAKIELGKLKKHTSDAFILDQGGKHYVYAGSYLLDSRAASEKERLTAAGFTLTLKREEVSIPSKNLSAGVFSDKKAADAAVKKLKDVGLKATLKQL